MAMVCKPFGDIITFTRASGATWFNSAGNLIGVDFSTSSNTIGTGSKTFTLNATAGVDRSWATGDTVLIVDQANSANNMTGAVTSYTASTQALVVNVTSTAGSGTITSWRVGNLMKRLDYNPSTLAAQGLLIEEARTNSIRNNTMQGAAAGTPGTLPTNWSTFTSLTGLTREVVGTGTENGITYIDLRLSGTPSAAGRYDIWQETDTGVPALQNQTWALSMYIKLQAGSLAGISLVRLYFEEKNNVGGYLVEQNTTVPNPTSAALSTQRVSATRTLTNAATAFLMPGINFSLSGAAIDITLRIGLPQLELGAFATSVIPTTTTALTRSADVASVNTLSPWYNATEGTLFADSTATYIVPATSFPTVATFTDGANNNRLEVGYVTSGVASAASVVGGVLQAEIYPAISVSNRRTAFAYKVNDFAACSNGGAVGTDTSGALPTVDRMNIGSNATGNRLNGYLRRIVYYPRRLSNAELQSITS